MFTAIEEIFNEQIRPALASHGGNIELMDIDDDTVFIKLSGGCHGCSSSQTTVKQGIETLLKQKFPFIQRVVDVTDHQKGMNPYM